MHEGIKNISFLGRFPVSRVLHAGKPAPHAPAESQSSGLEFFDARATIYTWIIAKKFDQREFSEGVKTSFLFALTSAKRKRAVLLNSPSSFLLRYYTKIIYNTDFYYFRIFEFKNILFLAILYPNRTHLQRIHFEKCLSE